MTEGVLLIPAPPRTKREGNDVILNECEESRWSMKKPNFVFRDPSGICSCELCTAVSAQDDGEAILGSTFGVAKRISRTSAQCAVGGVLR